MRELIDSVLQGLTSTTADGAARSRALASIRQKKRDETSFISYQSAGNVLIVDALQREVDRERAIKIAKSLTDSGLYCTVLLGGLTAASRDRLIVHKLSTKNVTVVAGEVSAISGFLGRFSVNVSGSGETLNLNPPGRAGAEFFDLILDLDPQPFLRREVLPPGYYAPRGNPQELRAALQEIPQMIGEFEKPVYVGYQFALCAHGSKGLTGCRRCLETCPALALTSGMDRIGLDTSLCQGCGICTVACPTGALSYACPPAHEWLGMIRELLNLYRDAGGAQPDVLFYDGRGASVVRDNAADFPGNLIPLAVEEIGAVGLDAWLAALAWGAGAVALLIGAGTPQGIVTELERQLAFARALLAAMGYSTVRLRWYRVNQAQFPLPETAPMQGGSINEPAGFAPFEKRKTIRLALDHLYRQASQQPDVAPLPQGAPFGEIQVDHGRCTLCMSCVAACPVSALYDAVDQPRLSFLEKNCIQCGLCSRVCPEDAITLVPRYLYDYEAANRQRVLLEEKASRCTACGRPFASRRMLERMTEKLSGHWMYQDEAARRRLQMCEDCRIKDLFAGGDRLDYH